MHAVKVVLLQFNDDVECVEILKNQTEQSDTLSDCESILNEMHSLAYH